MKPILKLLLALALALSVTPASAASASAASAAPVRNWTVELDGTVSSGGEANKLAIAGAKVTIYHVRTDGTHSLATGTSDPNGRFRLSLNLNNGGILYAVARKGPTVKLMTIIGTAIPRNIVINEMTTVATAYAMARIIRNGTIPSTPLLPAQIAAGMAENLVSAATGLPSTVMKTSPNANQTNAWRSLGTLANILAACVRNSGSACADLFALTPASNGGLPTTTLDAMVNIARNPGANVKPLFALGEAEKVFAPNLVAARNGPDAPNKFMRLDAFTLAIKFNATGRVDANGDELCPFAGLGNMVFNEKGYAWITNNVVAGTPYSTNCQIVLKPNGQPADGAGNTPNSPLFGGGILGQGFGIGFDPSGNLWSGNFGWGGVNPTDVNGNPGGSVSKFTGAGEALSPPYGITSSLYQVQGTVSDKNGNIWLASNGNSRLQVFPKGNPYSNFPYYQDANKHPFDIRLDNDGSGWVSYTNTSTASKLRLTKSGLVHLFTVPVGTAANPKGLAVDSKGNAWITAGGEDAIYTFDKNGNPLGKFTGGGIIGPWGVTVDSDNMVWVANFAGIKQLGVKYGISKLCGATASNCPAGFNLGDPITADTGYTLPSAGEQVLLHNGKPLYYPLPIKSYKPLMRLTAVEIDAAGNIWAMNNWKPDGPQDVKFNPGGDAVVIFVGLAAPVMPVLYSAPAKSPFSTP